ncbi:NAD(P)(+)--arginine ADP-ribosyltransferase 2-like protein [Labeo rohita]|uniref:NAD(P)(+)--arginine ADP-ribosyltransferase n=1 Tax=Labeo rohita TaxID=84645 RepID=A0A498MTR6_LABRO|nr:NAD(P)(+)--arginine ADP-ribosyltransferase 2-like protein [Labeo rohita]
MIEALLLISAAIGQVHSATTAEPILPLDMALSSVDDQYDGCTDKMAKLVTTKLLETELSSSTEFNTAWQKSKGKEPKEALTKNHMIAIYVYTDSIYKSLNEADRHDREKYIDKTYKWYSLHFLLTEAIQILKKTQKSCYSTYRSVHREFDKNVLNKEFNQYLGGECMADILISSTGVGFEVNSEDSQTGMGSGVDSEDSLTGTGSAVDSKRSITRAVSVAISETTHVGPQDLTLPTFYFLPSSSQ